MAMSIAFAQSPAAALGGLKLNAPSRANISSATPVKCMQGEWRGVPAGLGSTGLGLGRGVGASRTGQNAPLRSTRIVTRASSDDMPPGMTLETAREILGVSENASFDQIVSAKNVSLTSAGENMEQKIQVETAYDMLLMKSLTARKSGEVLNSDVKFADVRKAKPVGQQVTAILDKIPGGGLGVEKPKSTSDGWKQQAAFAVLAAASLAQGFPNDGPDASDAPGLQLALSFGASIYFLREKKNLTLSRAALLSGAGLVAGAAVGGILQAWLRVDIVPVPLVDAPVVLVSLFSILGMWASSTFLF